jgi:hypothetical protein
VVFPHSREQFSRHALFYYFLEMLAHFSREHSLGLVGHVYDMTYQKIFYWFIDEA